MRPDRPLIGAVACMAAGVGMIVAYCQGAASMNAAYPFTGSTLHLDLTTSGPAVLSGLALTAVGLLLLAWAVLMALASQFSLLVGREEREDRMGSIFHRGRESHFEGDEDYSGSVTMRGAETPDKQRCG